MINSKQRTRLYANWIHRETLTTNAEVRLYDPLSPWECYIIAMNESFPDEIYIILNGAYPETATWTLSEVIQCYNSLGDHPVVDEHFKPENAGRLLRKLNDKKHGLYGYKRTQD